MARREHSVTELTRKLLQRGFVRADIELVLTTLGEENLLSQQRFTENYIHHRRNKGYGPMRIRAELKERGIPEELIEHHLQMADNAWLVMVKQVWEKRFKKRVPTDYKGRATQMRFLQYRGFTQEQIESVFLKYE